MQVTVKQGQNIFDIAMQTAGTVSAAFEIALLNNRSITDYLQTGDILENGKTVNKKMLQHYKDNGLFPATAGEQNNDALFWNTFMHPDNYLYSNSSLITNH